MIDQCFINHYNIGNSDLVLIISIMRHPKAEDARRFLCMINDVMDYYMSTTDEEVRYPLLYIPASEPWAQEVCIEFVALKLSLLYNSLIQKKLILEIGIRNYVYIPENCTHKRCEQLRANYKYSKHIYNQIKDKYIPEESQRKNLVICKPFNCSTPENPYLDNYCGNEKSICNKSFALTRADIDIDKLDKHIKRDKGNSCKIENMFVFLSRSTDGRFSDAYSFQKPRIERLNKLGAGIQNVFYFYFSTKPFKLQRLLTWKLKNAADILHEDIKNMKDFISLSAEESDYIFGRVHKQTNYIIELKELDDFKSLAYDALEACEYNVQARNNLAICYDEFSQELFKNEFGNTIDDIDAPYFDIYLKNIQDTWKNNIFPTILSFMDGQTEASLILDYFIPEKYKLHIASLFKTYNIHVTTATFKSLKYNYVDGKYLSNNTSNKIIVLSYQGHYVGRPYNHYPNSFDPIYIGTGQELLNVLNNFVFDPYYAVHNYEYLKTLKNVLSSDYRKNYVKCTIPLPNCSKRKIEDSNDRTTSRSGSRGLNQNYQRYRVSTGDGATIKLIESDYVICKENNTFSFAQIIPASELNSQLQESDHDFLICSLSELQDTLEIILKKSEEEIKKDELYIRQDGRYTLSDEEILSDSELWEILLRRRVEQHGSAIVYAELMSRIPYSEQIKVHSFERWYTPNNNMILPRSRRMQDAIFEYLSIAMPYDKIIRRKKAQKGTMTERKNSMLRTFLCNNLFSEDFKQSFERLGDGIKDMLGIDNPGDLEALIDLLKKEINYVEIKTMSKYDKN